MSTTLEDLTDAVSTFGQTATERMDATDAVLADLRGDIAASSGNASQPLGRKTEPDDLGSSTQRAQVHGPVARRSQTHGFGHFGDFAASVRQAGMHGGSIDEKLLAAAVTTNANEASGGDGGFAVPPEYRATIMEKAFGENSLFASCMQVTVAGNQLTVPTSMTTPWSTDGIQAYWTGEAANITQSKPSLENVTVKLDKLAALIPVTEELLDDAPAMGALVSSQAAEKIDYKLSYALAWGTGAGMPLGFMNAPALITQAKEGSQSADTIEATNVVKMASRLPVQSRTKAVWLIHPDAEHQLPLMTLGDQPIFMPPGGLRDTPFGRLLGRPVIPHQVCSTVGDLGDIMLVDLSKYLTAVKAGGLRTQTSIHMWFDQDITAFKFTLRVAGQPWWSEPTTAANGSFTQSPFVTLAERT